MVILAVGAWAGYMIIHAHTPVRIGVLLPLTGDVELKEPLEWAKAVSYTHLTLPTNREG